MNRPLKPRCGGLLAVAVLWMLVVGHSRAAELPVREIAEIAFPQNHDYSMHSLRKYVTAVRDQYGGDERNIPLEVKAEVLEWMLWRYHRNPHGQFDTSVELPIIPGARPLPRLGSDTSTWNGALLAGLSYKYAVTRDPQTLQRIVTLVQGLRFYTTVTGRPGCYARCVLPATIDVEPNVREKFGFYQYEAPDGTRWSYLGDPAKGTYNQLAGGYSSLMTLVADDLPADVQATVRQDVSHFVMHVIRDSYHIRGPDDRRTSYGDLTPIVASVGVPFNGQVAYQIVALGNYFCIDDPPVKDPIAYQFYRLRDKRHAYYKAPHKSLIRPQRIGDHPLVKGMNDRNHVTNAAYYGLMLDVDRSRRTGQPLDAIFMYRLGRTMYWSMRRIGHQRNALCNFMWAGMLNDPERRRLLIRQRERADVDKQVQRVLDDGVEQLRRYSIDRFKTEGNFAITKQMYWVDQQRPNAYQWRGDGFWKWNQTGPATSIHFVPIDYLIAYWIFRYHELDMHPAVQRHRPVLMNDRLSGPAGVEFRE